jgi:undecaprenyl-diphosphatase
VFGVDPTEGTDLIMASATGTGGAAAGGAADRTAAAATQRKGPAPVHDAPAFRGEGAPGSRCLAELAVAWAALVAVAVAVGRTIGDETVLDVSASEWFVRNRNGDLDLVSRILSLAGDTYTVIAIASAVVVVGFVRRQRDGLIVLVVAMVGEVTIFLTITAIVSRPRPDVARLDGAPPTSSFPSGHTFAAIVLWGALAVVATRSAWSPWLRRLFLGLMVGMPLLIGISRLYRGMHHLTDVLAALVLGTAWLMIVLRILPDRRGGPDPRGVPDRSGVPDRRGVPDRSGGHDRGGASLPEARA